MDGGTKRVKKKSSGKHNTKKKGQKSKICDKVSELQMKFAEKKLFAAQKSQVRRTFAPVQPINRGRKFSF